MKQVMLWNSAKSFGKKIMLTCLTMMIAIVSFAQDKQVDVNINADKGGGFFASPVVWVIGVAVFILLLVALTRNNSRSRSDA